MKGTCYCNKSVKSLKKNDVPKSLKKFSGHVEKVGKERIMEGTFHPQESVKPKRSNLNILKSPQKNTKSGNSSRKKKRGHSPTRQVMLKTRKCGSSAHEARPKLKPPPVQPLRPLPPGPTTLASPSALRHDNETNGRDPAANDPFGEPVIQV